MRPTSTFIAITLTHCLYPPLGLSVIRFKSHFFPRCCYDRAHVLALFYALLVINSPYHPLKNDLSDVFDLLVCFLIDVSEAADP